ncbi:hypothetical protein [Bordetella sp. H567]|uniref:hypothetical protein n=1 Tax=Bordetella sp. H567 TaxID=1697043 RepID=UPI001911B65F|nr:hypothetical protein [Bordetella sp. H567]
MAPSTAGHGDSARARPDAQRHRAGRGSWLLASAVQRLGVAALISVALWAMTAWAMGWW